MFEIKMNILKGTFLDSLKYWIMSIFFRMCILYPKNRVLASATINE